MLCSPRWGRTARSIVAGCAALTLSAVTAAHAGRQSSFDRLLTELASTLARSVAPGEAVQVASADAQLADALRDLLTRAGVRVAGDNAVAAVIVSVTCADTVRERVCSADLRRGGARTFVTVQQPPDVDVQRDRPLVLQLQPLVADAEPILDVALAGSRLLLLRPSSVAQYEADSEGWRLQDVRPTMSRGWPRDPRGRLTVDKTSLELFLPGASCRGRIDPLQLTCADGERPWPIGIDNAGVVRARNYFSAQDGYRYYAVAALGRDAGAAWLVADVDGRLTFLDDGAQRSAAASAAGDDVARIATACAPGSHVLIAQPATIDAADSLRLFRVADRRLIAATPPIVLTGTLTALWPTSREDVATAVAFNSARQRYEAFQVGVSCGR